MSSGWEIRDSDRDIARAGVMLQAQLAALDVNHPAVKKFLANQIEVIASHMGEAVWLRQILEDIRSRGIE